MEQTITIPKEFQDRLRPTSRPKDPRSDEEILESLTKYQPVTSEKNIWGFWDKGVQHMRPWLKKNVVQWVKVHGPSGWKIRILDSVPNSENNALKYISPDSLPKAYIEGKMDGKWQGQHSADFMRAPLLYQYGGVYMDVSVIPFMTMDHFIWDNILDDSNPHRIAGAFANGPAVINFLVVARRGDPFILKWHEVFMHLWKNRTNTDGVADDPVVAPGFQLMREHFEGNNLPVIGLVSGKKLDAILEYGAQICCWTKVVCTQEPGEGGFDGATYWTEHTAGFPMPTETSYAELLYSDANRIFELLSLSRGEDVKKARPEDWEAAHHMVWSMMSMSAFWKLGKAANFASHPLIGNIMDGADNNGADAKPGTFFELLRYGVENFEQTQHETELQKPAWPTMIVKKGMTEP